MVDICEQGLAHFRSWLSAPINQWRAKGPASGDETIDRHVKMAGELLTWFNENLKAGELPVKSLEALWRLGPVSVFSAFTRMVALQLRGAQRLTWNSVLKRLVRAHLRRPPPRHCGPSSTT